MRWTQSREERFFFLFFPFFFVSYAQLPLGGWRSLLLWPGIPAAAAALSTSGIKETAPRACATPLLVNREDGGKKNKKNNSAPDARHAPCPLMQAESVRAVTWNVRDGQTCMCRFLRGLALGLEIKVKTTRDKTNFGFVRCSLANKTQGL